MDWLDWGVVGAFLLLLLTVGGSVLMGVWAWGFGGWMEYLDRRGTRTREKAIADLTEYGPTAVGLRDELLPEDLRKFVLDARAASEQRWGKQVQH